MSDHRTIYFVCVNYNNSKCTVALLDSLARLEKKSAYRVCAIVVDNASTDSSFQELQSCIDDYVDTRLVRSEVNLGYFGGLNLGLAQIPEGNQDFVVIGNNDLEFSKTFFSNLLARTYEDDILVVAPNVITADGYHQNPHCPTRVSKFRRFLYDVYFTHFWFARLLTIASYQIKRLNGGRQNPRADQEQVVHMGIGACYVLTAAFFKHFKKLDDSVFLYGEEALLAGQVAAANGRTLYDPKLVVRHVESATLSKLPSRKVYGFAKESYPRYRQYL
jgi:GT2 family glycosyltransferase